MIKLHRFVFFAFLFAGLGMFMTRAQEYYTPKQLVAEFESLSNANASKAKLHSLPRSPGGNQLVILEIGSKVNQMEKKNPAIFITTNPEEINPML